MTLRLWDAHVHLDFMRDPREIAREAEALGFGMFAVTVTPQGYQRVLPVLADAPNIALGVGLHPWWAADGRCGPDDAALAAELARTSRYVGEIGLDASPKHVPADSLPRQTAAFEQICSACGETSDPKKPKILSLHTVMAAEAALDILERTGCLANCRCVFHWFTGSNEALTRAMKAGCLFSVNEMMLRTRRGREYARQIPEDRLLLETDLPPGQDVPFHAELIRESLERTLGELEQIRGKALRETIRKNAAELLDI